MIKQEKVHTVAELIYWLQKLSKETESVCMTDEEGRDSDRVMIEYDGERIYLKTY